MNADESQNGALERIAAVLQPGLARRTEGELESAIRLVAGAGGVFAADGLLKRLQVARKHRRLSVGIYDHALHVIGGGQKYAAAMASLLQDRFDVTFLVNREVDLDRVGAWYGLDLSRCKTRLVRLPFFEGREWIDSAAVSGEVA